MNTNKILMSIIILIMITSASIAGIPIGTSNITTNTTNDNTTKVTEKTSVAIEDLPAEEQINSVNITANKVVNRTRILANGTRNIENMVSPEWLGSSTSYTNPITGISVFGAAFVNYIYTQEHADWDNYTFYLPVSSYTYINVNGRVEYSRFLTYEMEIDNIIEQHNNQVLCDTPDDFYLGCSIPFQMSRVSYLSKGYHTMKLSGSAEMGALGTCGPNGTENCYGVDGYISIMTFPEYTAITTTIPNGGESWAKGTTKTITWISNGQPGANVKIELYKSTARSAVISSKTSNDGSYSWYIPAYQPIGSDYKIKITSYENPTYLDWSNNNFRIY